MKSETLGAFVVLLELGGDGGSSSSEQLVPQLEPTVQLHTNAEPSLNLPPKIWDARLDQLHSSQRERKKARE